jgi:hypothetical protein
MFGLWIPICLQANADKLGLSRSFTAAGKENKNSDCTGKNEGTKDHFPKNPQQFTFLAR